jgi:hypothetical protein
MDSRSYFASNCTAGHYDFKQYVALNLLGKTMRYTTDLSGAGCGCNAAFYLTSMRQNERPSQCFDYYCDANNVCGESCAEIDIQEANQRAWHSTLHTATDHGGVGAGYGGGDSWDGPRDWTSQQYGPGAGCIDTSKPFVVAVSFPTDAQGQLAAMEVQLSQPSGRLPPCPLSVRVGSYSGMAELSRAMAAGMTPIVSYWSDNNMLWMDGKGSDGQGPCASDNEAACSEHVKFYGFSVASIASPSLPTATPKIQHSIRSRTIRRPQEPVAIQAGPEPTSASHDTACSRTQKADCRETQCCEEFGMQCYEKNQWWAACKRTCQPGGTDPEDPTGQPWTCRTLGTRTADGFLLTVETPEAIPHVEVGTQLTLVHGTQRLRARIVDVSEEHLGSTENRSSAEVVMMKRWAVTDNDPVRATDLYHSWWLTIGGALFLVAAALLAALVARAARQGRPRDQLSVDADSPFMDLGAVEISRRLEFCQVERSSRHGTMATQ